MKKNPGRKQRRQLEQRNRRISHKTADIRNKVDQKRRKLWRQALKNKTND